MSSPPQETPSNSSASKLAASPNPKNKVTIKRPLNKHSHLELKGCANGRCSNVKSFSDQFPTSYQFSPTDAELIVYYLRKKVMNEALPLNKIIKIRLLDHNPETISSICEKEQMLLLLLSLLILCGVAILSTYT